MRRTRVVRARLQHTRGTAQSSSGGRWPAIAEHVRVVSTEQPGAPHCNTQHHMSPAQPRREQRVPTTSARPTEREQRGEEELDAHDSPDAPDAHEQQQQPPHHDQVAVPTAPPPGTIRRWRPRRRASRSLSPTAGGRAIETGPPAGALLVARSLPSSLPTAPTFAIESPERIAVRLRVVGGLKARR